MDLQLKLKIKDEIVYPERNGKPLLCPHYTRLLVPSRMANSVDLNASICSSQCMKFKCGFGGDPDRLLVEICDTGIELEGKMSVMTKKVDLSNFNL
jgi:hypothetical protein